MHVEKFEGGWVILGAPATKGTTDTTYRYHWDGKKWNSGPAYEKKYPTRGEAETEMKILPKEPGD